MAVENITPPASLPWFQFYYQDFLVGAACLSLAERGAYITLICHQWTRGSIPDDATVRARLLGCSKREADAAWAGIASKFQQGADGAWRNPRVEVEREKQAQHRANGARGGFAKSQGKAKRNPRDSSGSSQPPSQGLAKGYPKPSQPPSQDLAKGYTSESESESETERSRSALKSAPIFARARTAADGPLAGTLPRDHLNCHPPCVRVCLSEKQHAILRERHGGTDADLDAFYAEVRADIEGPVGMRSWEFWESQFIARFGGTVNRKTAGNVAAAQAWLRDSRRES